MRKSIVFYLILFPIILISFLKAIGFEGITNDWSVMDFELKSRRILNLFILINNEKRT